MLKKVLIIGLVVFVGVIGLGFVYLNNIYIPKHLKPMVIEQLEKNLAKDVEIDKAFYFPFKGVLFSQIAVFNPDGSIFLEIDKVDLSLKSFPKIRTNQVNLKSRLLVKGLSFKQNELAAKGSAAVDVELEIIDKQDPVFNAKIKLDDVGVKGLPSIADIERLNGEVFCDQGSFKSAGLNAFIAGQQFNIFLDGKYSKSDMHIEQLKIDYGKTNFELKAKILDLEKINVQADSFGSIDLADINKILTINPMPVLKGYCSFNAKADGPFSDLNAFKANAHAEILQGAVDMIKFSDLKADINFEKSAIDLAPFTCAFYQGKISAAAKAELKDIIPINGSIDIEQVDLQPLVNDILAQDMGAGKFNAHIGVSGSAMDINNLTGSGWFKIEQAALKPPPRFKKVAKSLNLPELADMLIEQSSATFSLIDGKVHTEDFIAVANYASLYGKGYIDLEQYVDFEVKFKLAESMGDSAQIANIAADGAKVKLYDKVSKLKYKVEFSAEDVIKSQSTKILKGLFEQNSEGQQSDSDNIDIQKQLEKGLKKLFK